jgi:threonine dehydratase
MSVVEQSTLTAADVLEAAQRITPYIHRTPVITSRLLNAAAGKQVFLKCENLQRGGAFKLRGAFNFLLRLTPEQRQRGVVAFSSGNHAQAVAIAAAELGVKASIVMPEDAPKSKIEATRSYGPEIHLYNRQTEDRERIAAQVASKTGAALLPPYDHAWVVAGQGTAALELLQQVPELDAVVTPLGGGGLLAGSILIAKSQRPSIKVFGIEPETANDWALSIRAGERISIGTPPTIADGLRTPSPGVIPFDIVRAQGDGVFLVSDDEMKNAVRFLLTRVKTTVEPSGAVGVAAALSRRLPENVKRVGIVLSGGNIDLQTLAEICGEDAGV